MSDELDDDEGAYLVLCELNANLTDDDVRTVMNTEGHEDVTDEQVKRITLAVRAILTGP